MPKYTAPGLTGINIGGQQFNADKDGVITLPDEGNWILPAEFTQVPDVAPVALTPAKSAAKVTE